MHKVLIANRGEVAVRIIRSCRELGIKTVAVCSTADLQSMHVQLADESLCIGEGPATQSYLQSSMLLAAAELSGADALHPGYGFLSENPRLAELCQQAGVLFIGPTAKAMGILGNKLLAKSLAVQCGIPTVPSSPRLERLEEAEGWSQKIGFPLLIKTACGGGGRGIRSVHAHQGLAAAWHAVWSESTAAYGRAELYLERLVEGPRHVEVQIAGDLQGHVMALGERDCSVQRRRQKLIEEAPCAWLEERVRQQLYEAACTLARQAGYHTLGTAEFLVEADGSFYFMEFNSRLQVEHTVTETILGIDLVALQMQLAEGMPIPEELKIRLPSGHAIQLRMNAEDPLQGFQPSPGRVESCRWPAGLGVRIDSAVESGSIVPPYYDALIGKIIVHGADRPAALARVARALHEFRAEGIHTNSALHMWILQQPAYQAGGVSITWLEEHLEEFFAAARNVVPQEAMLPC